MILSWASASSGGLFSALAWELRVRVHACLIQVPVPDACTSLCSEGVIIIGRMGTPRRRSARLRGVSGMLGKDVATCPSPHACLKTRGSGDILGSSQLTLQTRRGLLVARLPTSTVPRHARRRGKGRNKIDCWHASAKTKRTRTGVQTN